VRSGEQLSAEKWNEVFAYIQRMLDVDAASGHAQLPDAVKDASKATLEKARSEYAAEHKLTAKQVADLEPIRVLGEY
jgi:hypothetical protein